MASLNWTQLDKNDHPIPLPHEKFLSTIPHVSLSLSSPSLSSLGTLHISNLRFILISLSPRSSATPATPGGTSTDLDSLSVPYTHFHDGRFIQPMFGAQRYEATILPSPGGGLTGPSTMKLTFKESGGAGFYELVTEMKERSEASGGRAAQVENLPLYAPPEGPPPPIEGENRGGEEEMEIAAVVVEEEEREREEGSVNEGEMPPGYVP